jgi:hypothetical protein
MFNLYLNKRHRIIEDCFEVDHNQRPNFSQLVPRIEKLTSDTHKQYYELLNDRFKRECNEIIKDRLRSNGRPATNTTLRDSSQTNQPVYNNQLSVLNPQTPTAKPSSAGYLEPIQRPNGPVSPLSVSSSDYQELNKDSLPVRPNLNVSSDGYLQPSDHRTTTQIQIDTYGGTDVGGRITSDAFKSLENRYVNEDVVNELESKRLSNRNPNTTKIDYIDQDDQSTSYVMPRQASLMSSSSTGSNVPLLKKKTKMAPIAPPLLQHQQQQETREKKSEAIYMLSQPSSKLVNGGKLSLQTAKPATETEV